MKILFVLENFHPRVGGVETMFFELGRRLVARGHRVTVLTSGVAGSPAREKIAGMEIFRTRTRSRYLFTFAAVPMAVRLARGADLIHATTYNAVFPGWVGARIAGKKFVLTVHEVYGRRWREMEGMSFWKAAAHRALEFLAVFWPADAKTAPSDATLRDLRAVRGASRGAVLRRIYHGVDEDFFAKKDPERSARIRADLGFESDKKVVLFFGRPAIAKGAEVLARAFCRAIGPNPNLRAVFLLGGGGGFLTRRRQVEQILSAEIAAGRAVVRDAVPRADLPAWLGAADFVAVPSFAEGFGFSAAEAIAAGRPVILTRAGSLPEVAAGRVIFAEPRDEISLAAALGRAARGDFETLPERHFLWGDAVKNYENLYRKLLKK